MKKLGLIVIVVSTMQIAHAMDIRKGWLEFPHNKQDENGNTFWHELVKKAEGFEDWSQITQEVNSFSSKDQRWLPNLFIENKDNRTARQEAKISFKNCGNPVVGLLCIYLRNKENDFLNKMASKDNRESMNYAQYLDSEAVQKLSREQIAILAAQKMNETKKNV